MTIQSTSSKLLQSQVHCNSYPFNHILTPILFYSFIYAVHVLLSSAIPFSLSTLYPVLHLSQSFQSPQLLIPLSPYSVAFTAPFILSLPLPPTKLDTQAHLPHIYLLPFEPLSMFTFYSCNVPFISLLILSKNRNS